MAAGPRPADPGTTTEPTDDPGPDAPDVPAARPSASPAELAILAYAMGLLILWSPQLNAGLVTPRAALVLIGLGPGLVLLARARDRAAGLAAGYLAWALVAAVASGQPRIALVGTYASDLGWIYLAGALSAWGLGRRLGIEGRRLLVGVVFAGLAVNGLVALAQTQLDPGGLLRMTDGRASGLTPNSLFLGGLAAGALAMAGSLVGRAGPRWVAGAAGVAGLAAVCNLTGSRAALLGGAGLALAGCLLSGGPSDGTGTRRERGLRTAAVGAALVAGVVLSLPLLPGESATTRASTSQSGGFTARGEMWSAGVEAGLERPITGWGPGRFRAATSERTTVEFVRAEGSDRLFYDAHNLLVEHLTTTGIVGLVLLGLFAWEAFRRSRGPLAWFAGGVAVTWLFTPMSISTGPLVLLAVGAAWSHRGTADPHPVPAHEVTLGPRSRVLALVLAALGLVAGGTLVTADAIVKTAVEQRDPQAVQRARRLLPPDAVLADLEASAWRAAASEGAGVEALERAVEAAEEAIELDPTRSTWWVRYGYAQAASGVGTEEERQERAEAAFGEALERSPWSAEAMTGMLRFAELRGDEAAARRWQDRLCETGVCPEP